LQPSIGPRSGGSDVAVHIRCDSANATAVGELLIGARVSIGEVALATIPNSFVAEGYVDETLGSEVVEVGLSCCLASRILCNIQLTTCS